MFISAYTTPMNYKYKLVCTKACFGHQEIDAPQTPQKYLVFENSQYTRYYSEIFACIFLFNFCRMLWI